MLLKIGSSGADVIQLQTKLGITADGDFGPGTEAKVKTWQTQNNLPANGIVDDANWAKLFPPVVIPPSNFKLQNLKGHIPDTVIAQIPGVAPKFNITNVLRLAHFLAQCSHESGNFKATSENLFYSADGLVKTFPSYFTAATAGAYANNPAKIASRVYASRMGNGNEASGDGYKFRGTRLYSINRQKQLQQFCKIYWRRHRCQSRFGGYKISSRLGCFLF